MGFHAGSPQLNLPVNDSVFGRQRSTHAYSYAVEWEYSAWRVNPRGLNLRGSSEQETSSANVPPCSFMLWPFLCAGSCHQPPGLCSATSNYSKSIGSAHQPPGLCSARIVRRRKGCRALRLLVYPRRQLDLSRYDPPLLPWVCQYYVSKHEALDSPECPPHSRGI